MEPANQRRMPMGAEVLAGAVHFRVWAPRCRSVEVAIESGNGGAKAVQFIELAKEEGGYFSGLVASAGPGTRYRYRLDASDPLPDPAARFQPEGPHGPSEVVDPSAFAWTDAGWPGKALKGQVIYEMHIGTFTREGTWSAATGELAELADLGVTVLEVMPVAEFPGNFGWGYDGVDLFAPSHLYGTPDDFRRYVDRAHALGLGVILDVVYNHFGPDSCYLRPFAEHYFTERIATEWGEAINFDGPNSGPVREFFIANAVYWIDEYHLDGLRFDATQSIFDRSEEHILAAVAHRVRQAAKGRATLLVAENEPQETRVVRSPNRGGYGLDGIWNDDFHHSAMVALTGRNEAYYTDYLGRPQEFISVAKYGHLYQGQYYAWQKHRRGTSGLGLPPEAFVTFIQNHDQVANSARGLRVHARTSPGRYRALTALMLLGPGTPMLFQGQEFAASSPFLYFADHPPELARLVNLGRAQFLAQFPTVARAEMQALLRDPAARETFEACKLDLGERQRHAGVYALHRDLLTLRREDAVFSAQRPLGVDGAVLGEQAFVLRFFNDGDDRLLLVNLGRDLDLTPAPEPLLAPPRDKSWRVLWSSEDPRYGGNGTPPLESKAGGHLLGEAAMVLVAGAPEEDVEWTI